MKNTKSKSAPAIKWVKGDCPVEWVGGIDGKPVFEVLDNGALFLLERDSVLLGYYSASRTAKRGAERFAKRMRELFA